MKNFNENRVRNEPLLRCVRKLGDGGLEELRKVLRKQFSHEIEWAVWHRVSGGKNTPCLPDDFRKELRGDWAEKDCPVCGEYMHHDITEKCHVEVEHIIERALGGKNELSNLVPCCNNCNRVLGKIFNQYIIQAKEKRSISDKQWIHLVGEWCLFKQLLYWDQNLAFWLFEKFHRQFINYAHRPIERKERHGNFDWLINRSIISERIENAVRELEKSVARKEFEMTHGSPPKILDMSAYARTYRNRLKAYMNEVVS